MLSQVTSLPIPRKDSKNYLIKLTTNSLKEYELNRKYLDAPVDGNNVFETEDEETEDEETRIESEFD